MGSGSMMFGESPGVAYGWKMSAIVWMAVLRSDGWCAIGVDGIGFCSVLIRVFVASTAISVLVGNDMSIVCGKKLMVSEILSAHVLFTKTR
jgi:hypothetical protein